MTDVMMEFKRRYCGKRTFDGYKRRNRRRYGGSQTTLCRRSYNGQRRYEGVQTKSYGGEANDDDRLRRITNDAMTEKQRRYKATTLFHGRSDAMTKYQRRYDGQRYGGSSYDDIPKYKQRYCGFKQRYCGYKLRYDKISSNDAMANIVTTLRRSSNEAMSDSKDAVTDKLRLYDGSSYDDIPKYKQRYCGERRRRGRRYGSRRYDKVLRLYDGSSYDDTPKYKQRYCGERRRRGRRYGVIQTTLLRNTITKVVTTISRSTNNAFAEYSDAVA
ncbi:hypothetical protein DPMN_086014 [Dreissena polymorpha]|uniref:Uncharacterized protein n=1 Tax=Dreissena polymorpha TaxID=45954 RepID=A0A9D3YHK4_DREPO|nr:hypothetical protein DPMN_086014 [Dreissena polymorpha]